MNNDRFYIKCKRFKIKLISIELTFSYNYYNSLIIFRISILMVLKCYQNQI